MAEDQNLQFIIKMKDEASASLKSLGGALSDLAAHSKKVADEAGKSAGAVNTFSGALKQHGVAAAASVLANQALNRSSEALTERMTSMAGAAGFVGQTLMRLGPAGLAAAAAIGATTGAVTIAISEFAEFQQRAIKFDTHLASIGQTGKITANEIGDLAEKFSATTMFDTDELEKAGIALAQLGFVGRSQVAEMLPIIADFAAKTGRGVAGAAQMMTRALTEPQRGLALLNREMRNVSESESKHVADLIEANKHEEARVFILQKMTYAAKGYATAMTTGITGSTADIAKQTKVYFAETLQDLGENIDAWLGLTGALAGVLEVMRNINKERVKTKERNAEIETPEFQARLKLDNAGSALTSAIDEASRKRTFFNDGAAAFFPNNGAVERATAAQERYTEALREYIKVQADIRRDADAEFGKGVDSSVKQKIEASLTAARGLDVETEAREKAERQLKAMQTSYDLALKHQDKYAEKIPFLKTALDTLTLALKSLGSALGALDRKWKIDLEVAGLSQFEKATFALATAKFQADPANHGRLFDKNPATVEEVKKSNHWKPAQAQVSNLASREQDVAETRADQLKAFREQERIANLGKSERDKKTASLTTRMADEALTKFGSTTSDQAKDYIARGVKLGQAEDTSAPSKSGDLAVEGLRNQLAVSKKFMEFIDSGLSVDTARVMSEGYQFAFEQAKSGAMSFEAALAAATPILLERNRVEALLKATEEARASSLQSATAKGIYAGGTAFAGTQAGWEQEADNFGLKGADRDKFLASKNTSYSNNAAGENAQSWLGLKQGTDRANMQASTATMSDRNQQIAMGMFDLRQKQAEGKLTDPEEWNRQAAAIVENADAMQKLREATGPLAQYIKDGQETWRSYQQAAVMALDATSSAFMDVISGAKTAQEAIAGLVKSFANMAAQMAFKAIASKVFSVLGPMVGLADGGIMTSHGSVPLRAYAGGGVANSPQMALFGEGKQPEAFVPLPDGRSIPVTMKGGGGSGTSIQNNFNVTVSGGAAQGGGQAAGGSPAIGQNIASALRNMVVEVLHDQLRMGGALNPVMG